MPRTRNQTRQNQSGGENFSTSLPLSHHANLKRSAIESPGGKAPQRKRSALTNLTNALGNALVIDSSKRVSKDQQKGFSIANNTKKQQQSRKSRGGRTSVTSSKQEDLTAIPEDTLLVSLKQPSSRKSTSRSSSEVSDLPSAPSSAGKGNAEQQIASSRNSSSSSDSEIEYHKRNNKENPAEPPPSSTLIADNLASGQENSEETVCDYDAENLGDPFNVPYYARDIFNYYRTREVKFKVSDYMGNQRDLTKNMRMILVDWMVEIQENFELNHETLYQAVKLTDLFLDRELVSKEDLQLVGSTALFVACKFDERIPPCCDDFLYICDDAYSKQDLLSMEQKILMAMDFDIGMPLSYRFVRRYAKTSKVGMETLTLARYILETSLMHYEFVSCSDSQIAAAAFLLALRMKKLGDWGEVQKYSGYDLCEIEPLMWRLNSMLKTPPPSKSAKTILNKYSHE